MTPNRTLSDLVQYRVQCLRTRRESFEDHWRDIADFVMPRSYRWLEDSDTWQRRGNKANKKIIDPSGTLAVRAMEAAFSASIIPTSRPWKVLKVNGELKDNYAVRAHLEAESEIIDSHILETNFYQEGGKLFRMTGLFGTGAMIIEEDEDDDFRCETLPTGSYWLGIDSKRRVNQFAREMEMTATQLVEMFGEKAVSSEVLACVNNKTGDKETRKILHWIGVNDKYSPSSSLSMLPYVSLYIDPSDKDKDKALRIGYYEEFPVITPRWSVMGDDVYGLDCPGMIALGHIKELQAAHKQMAKAIEKQVTPPTQRPEGTMRKGIDATPGADNVVSNRGASADGIKPLYQINFDINGVRQHIEDLRAQIRESFFYNLFLMVASERRSGTKAREIDELHEEKMIILSTVYEQFSTEFLDPAIKRIRGILSRRGRLPVPPPELAAAKIDIEYVSVMANAMKLVGIGNMDRALAVLGQVATIDPTVTDLVNFDRYYKNYADRLGVDVRVMSSPQEIEDKRSQRAASMQQAQMQQQAVVQADTAKVLSDTKTDEDNALTQLIGNTI